jgi:hypothetical protein
LAIRPSVLSGIGGSMSPLPDVKSNRKGCARNLSGRTRIMASVPQLSSLKEDAVV